jgi:hypothetical protein
MEICDSVRNTIVAEELRHNISHAKPSAKAQKRRPCIGRSAVVRVLRTRRVAENSRRVVVVLPKAITDRVIA